MVAPMATKLSRRSFNKGLIIFAGATLVPLISSCAPSEEKLAFLGRVNDGSFAKIERLSLEMIEQRSTVHQKFMTLKL